MKTYLSFLNYFSTTSFAIALKVSSGGRKIIFLIMEIVQISPCGFNLTRLRETQRQTCYH